MSSSDRIKRWIKPGIQSMQAYQVPDASGMIKLDAMENPYQLDADLQQQYLAVLAQAQINRYPDPKLDKLKPLLKQTFNIADELEILFGNGSDEIIQLIIMAVAEPGRVIIAPEPSFVMYKMLTEILGLKFVGVPLKEDFSLDTDKMLDAIKQHNPAAIFLAYPNNPTGNLFATDSINQIITASDGLVVIDEAYHIFSDKSYVEEITRHENVLVMRTLSKAGLAGLRFGFLIGNNNWISEIDKIRLPYNINTLTQMSMQFFLQNYAVFEQQAKIILRDRTKLLNDICQLSGISAAHSDANFLLLRCVSHSADEVFKVLLEQKILVKRLHGSHPLLLNCLRLSIGKPDENHAFMTAIKQLF